MQKPLHCKTKETHVTHNRGTCFQYLGFRIIAALALYEACSRDPVLSRPERKVLYSSGFYYMKKLNTPPDPTAGCSQQEPPNKPHVGALIILIRIWGLIMLIRIWGPFCYTYNKEPLK